MSTVTCCVAPVRGSISDSPLTGNVSFLDQALMCLIWGRTFYKQFFFLTYEYVCFWESVALGVTRKWNKELENGPGFFLVNQEESDVIYYIVESIASSSRKHSLSVLSTAPVGAPSLCLWWHTSKSFPNPGFYRIGAETPGSFGKSIHQWTEGLFYKAEM